jgi:hypothetical protein
VREGAAEVVAARQFVDVERYRCAVRLAQLRHREGDGAAGEPQRAAGIDQARGALAVDQRARDEERGEGVRNRDMLPKASGRQRKWRPG